MDPWGTPEITFWKLLCALFMQTYCFLFERWEYIYISRFSWTEYAASFAVNRSCGTHSKAFDKSIKTPSTTLLLSKFCLNFSRSLVDTFLELYPFLYAETYGEM